MNKYIKLLWRSISAAVFFFGLFWLPSDLGNTAEALKPWQKLLAMVDQLMAFKIFSGLLVLWVLWIDLRPTFRQWRNKKWPQEPTKPKLWVAGDIVAAGTSGGITEIGCRVRNSGVPAEVIATLTPVSGVHFDICHREFPVVWRNPSKNSARLIKSQSETFKILSVSEDKRVLRVPYLNEHGEVDHFEGSMDGKGGGFSRAIVEVQVMSNPENESGVLKRFMVVDFEFGKQGGGTISINPSEDLNSLPPIPDSVTLANETQSPQLPVNTATKKRRKIRHG